MGGSVVYFDKQRGANFTKGRKRMRGEPSSGPEIKKWNCLSGTGSNTASDFVNLVIPGESGVFGNYAPARLQWPSSGTASGQRLGASITWLGMRVKGWITISSTQLKQIRWRLVLCRYDTTFDPSITYNATNYLKQWANSDSSVPTTFNVERFESYCRHNFYKKFKDVANNSFKAKVIANGVLPATTAYQKLNIHLTGTVSGSAATLDSNSLTPSYVMGLHSGNQGYIPIDIKVKLNDTVNCLQDLRRYFLVLEADVGYGWNDDGSASSSYPGMILNIYTRGYFTDA